MNASRRPSDVVIWRNSDRDVGVMRESTTSPGCREVERAASPDVARKLRVRVDRTSRDGPADRYRPAQPTGPVALAFVGERRGCTPGPRLRGQPWRWRVLPWALARDGGSQGPLDLLTRLAYRRQDSAARALQRGLGGEHPTAV